MTKNFYVICSFQIIMANNVIVETHYTQHTNRPATGDSESSYQQLNYQTFQMFVVAVVDQLNSKEKTINYIIFYFFFFSSR